MIVDVEAVAHGGHCVARVDGRVVFVRHALPGERVRVVVTERNRGYWRADAVEILTSSPERVNPPCSYAGVCGGCDLQHVSQAGQLDWKTRVLREQLTRLGGLDDSQVADVTVRALDGKLLGWRTRMQYAVDERGRAGLRRHRSDEVIPIDRCAIATDAVADGDVLKRSWPARGVVNVVESFDGDLTVYTQRTRRSRSRFVSGPETTQHIVFGHEFRVPADGFWQVHPLAADTFVTEVLEAVGPRDGEIYWDLYAGAGLFSAALAEAVGPNGRVWAVESDPRSPAVKNLADLPAAEVVTERVEKAVASLPRPDVVVLDPPRSGATATVLSAIAEACGRAICYVACDPAALARDVRRLAEVGWKPVRFVAFDAFPMTQHFETIALFEPVDRLGDDVSRSTSAKRSALRSVVVKPEAIACTVSCRRSDVDNPLRAARLYSSAIVVPNRTGLSVPNATFTPASKNRGSG